MKTTLFVIAAISLLFLGLTFLGHNLSEKETQAQMSALNSLDAKQELNRFLASSDLIPIENEEIVVVNIWATWCGPCIAEIPELNQLAYKYKDANVRFLAFSNEDFSKYDEFLEKRPDFQFDYEMSWGNEEALEFLKGYDRKNKGASIPIHLMINRQGKVEEVLIGASASHTQVLESFLANNTKAMMK